MNKVRTPRAVRYEEPTTHRPIEILKNTKEFRFNLHRPDAHSALTLTATYSACSGHREKDVEQSRTSSFLCPQVNDTYLREQLKEVMSKNSGADNESKSKSSEKKK